MKPDSGKDSIFSSGKPKNLPWFYFIIILTILFENFKNIELKDRRIFEDERFKKLQNMNVCCLKLLESYREYTTKLKKSP